MRRWRTFADVRLWINPTCAPPTCYVAAKTVSAHVVIFLYSFTYFFQLSCSYKQQKRNYCNINSPAWWRSEILCICLLFLLFLSFIDLLIYSAGCYPAALKIKRNAPVRSAERLVWCIEIIQTVHSWGFCSFGVAFVSRLLNFCMKQQLWESFICFFFIRNLKASTHCLSLKSTLFPLKSAF